MNILVIGDVVSEPGCKFLRQKLSTLKKQKHIDFCVANGENSAVGNGVSPDSAEHLFNSGIDVITTGNHVYKKREIYDYLDSHDNIIRPANFYEGNPGVGFTKIDMGYIKVGIINLVGMAYMNQCNNPFSVVEEIIEEIRDCRIKLVDFHAESSAEKRAMGFFLDGKVSAVFGTHTHVLTADAQILKGGTGYITDIGMTGPASSVLGIKPEISIEWLKTGMPARFETAEGDCMLNGCIFEIDNKTGLCTGTEIINFN